MDMIFSICYQFHIGFSLCSIHNFQSVTGRFIQLSICHFQGTIMQCLCIIGG